MINKRESTFSFLRPLHIVRDRYNSVRHAFITFGRFPQTFHEVRVNNAWVTKPIQWIIYIKLNVWLFVWETSFSYPKKPKL